MRQIVLFVSVFMLCSVTFTSAAEPNYIKTTIYNVGKDASGIVKNLEATVYSNGIGKTVQSKQTINATQTKINSAFFDELGRQIIFTKPYIDKSIISQFTPGDFNTIDAILNNSSNYESFKPSPTVGAVAYSETKYYDDPLGRVMETCIPGVEYRMGSDHTTKFWYFGVPKLDRGFTINQDLSVVFQSGFIKEFKPNNDNESFEDCLKILSDFTRGLGAIPDFDHYLTVTKDVDGKFTQELKDIFGRTVARKSTVDVGGVTQELIGKCEYDILGNVTKEIAPKGTRQLIKDCTYKYNKLGQLIRKDAPDGSVDKYDYDAAGNITRKRIFFQGPDGYHAMLMQSLLYNYDHLSRLVSIKEENLTNDELDPEIMVENFYDNIDDLVKKANTFAIPPQILTNLFNLNGRLVAAVANNCINGKKYYVVDLYSYDDEGRVAVKYKAIPGASLQEITYTYDIQGKVTSENFKCGEDNTILYFAYDEFGDLKSIAHNTQDKIVTEYTNDILGRTSSKELAQIATGPSTVDNKYNLRGWLNSTKYNGKNSFSETLDYSENLVFNGNINSAILNYSSYNPSTNTTLTKKYTHDYGYDDVNRLISVKTLDKDGNEIPDYNSNYAYDQAGRFLSKVEGQSNHDAYNYYENTSRVKKSKVANALFIYDNNGNLVIDCNKKMVITHDWRNMPTKFTFFNTLPVGDETSNQKIRPDARGTITKNDSRYSGNPIAYINWLKSKGEITQLASVIMLYDASGNRVSKLSTD